MILYNAQIFTENDVFEPGYIEIAGPKIVDIVLGDNASKDFSSNQLKNYDSQEIIDCSGSYIIPGLIDIHFHGCNGHDFCEGSTEAIFEIAKYQAMHGILAICPATMTYTEELLMPTMNAAKQYDCDKWADLVGINMEGPFISPDKVGAQNPKYVQKPNYEMIKRLDEVSGGLVKLVDIAPEVNGAMEFIDMAADDFAISIAHTCTDYDTAKQAYKKGARHLTHTYNAMPGITHRAPGPIPAAAEEGASAEIICDGKHIHYASVRLIFKYFSKDKVCLISDSCEATGLADGKYMLGGQEVIKQDGKAVLAHDTNTIAASVTNLFDCLKHAIFDAGILMEDAILAATKNPAKAIGIEDTYGQISVDRHANLLVVDKDFNIQHIVKNGRIL